MIVKSGPVSNPFKIVINRVNFWRVKTTNRNIHKFFIPVKINIIIDASGKFIVPGLIDGFAVINNQEYANAFLYMGITSIIGVDGGRRGPFFSEADPSPDFYRLESVGDEREPVEKHLEDLELLYEKGYSIALLKRIGLIIMAGALPVLNPHLKSPTALFLKMKPMMEEDYSLNHLPPLLLTVQSFNILRSPEAAACIARFPLQSSPIPFFGITFPMKFMAAHQKSLTQI